MIVAQSVGRVQKSASTKIAGLCFAARKKRRVSLRQLEASSAWRGVADAGCSRTSQNVCRNCSWYSMGSRLHFSMSRQRKAITADVTSGDSSVKRRSIITYL